MGAKNPQHLGIFARKFIWGEEEGPSPYTCQVNRRELSGDRTLITFVAIKVHDQYTTVPLLFIHIKKLMQ